MVQQREGMARMKGLKSKEFDWTRGWVRVQAGYGRGEGHGGFAMGPVVYKSQERFHQPHEANRTDSTMQMVRLSDSISKTNCRDLVSIRPKTNSVLKRHKKFK